jgi:hypothetical protein
MTPKLYLIGRGLTDEQVERVRQALAITPLDAVVVSDPRDAELAKQYCDTVTALSRPIAILADFDAPLTAVNSDGSLTRVE